MARGKIKKTDIPNTPVKTSLADALSNAHQHAPTPAEVAERLETMTTQGRRGCKSPRINLRFTQSNYDFVKFAAACAGTDMTNFINLVLEDYRVKNEPALRKAYELQNDISKELFPALMKRAKDAPEV